MIIIVFRNFPCLSLKHETLVVSWILSAVESSRSHPRPISCQSLAWLNGPLWSTRFLHLLNLFSSILHMTKNEGFCGLTIQGCALVLPMKTSCFPMSNGDFWMTMFVLFHFPIRRAHTPINNLISPLKVDFPLKSGFFHYHQDLPTLASICTFQLTSCDSLTERPVTLYFPTTNEMSFLPSLPPDRFFREQPIPAHRGWNSRRKW